MSVPTNASATTAQGMPRTRAADSKKVRFQIRLSARQRDLLEKAAALEGRTLTDFVLTHAQGAAERRIETESLLVMSEQDTAAFLAAMHSSWEPSEEVLEEIRTMQQRLGEVPANP